VKELSDWSVRHLLPRPCGENIDGIDWMGKVVEEQHRAWNCKSPSSIRD
jgi:hypothetical protein